MKAVEDFIKAMETSNIKVEHQIVGEGDNKNECVHIGLCGNNFSGLVFHIVFDDEGSCSAQAFCNEICKFTDNKNLIMLQTVNALNTKYRWVTFFISEGGRVNANMSIAFTDDSAEQLLLKALEHFVGVIDVAYPILMKALYT